MKIYNTRVGDIYGIQEVIEVNTYNPESKGKRKILKDKCKCVNCGKITYKESRLLIKGEAISCTCETSKRMKEFNKQKNSVKVGNIYGFLEVVEILDVRKPLSRDKGERWAKCICHNCGNNNFEIRTNSLQNGNSKSCGCIKSRGETIIAKILKDNNINFAREYKFMDLKSENNVPYRFDFAVFSFDNKLDYLIEFDGRQHYTGPDATWKRSCSLEEIKKRDNEKNNYCIKNNIILKRIPYTDIQNITYDKIISNEYNI